jgi:gliding motility-associated-like protein
VRLQSIWFPNLFTPELDENNLFRAYGNRVRNYDLKVFTRWGDCIFHTTDFYQGWDGTYHGIKSPASAYVYLVHYTTPDGEPMTATGTVTLVR